MGFKRKMDDYRKSKNARLFIIIALLIILGVLFYFWKSMRVWIGALIVTIMIALGLEVSENDWDLGKLVETGSFTESKVEQTESGTWLIGDQCKKESLNCSNFGFQEEAQKIFEDCGGLKNDVHGLDRDKDGKVCESLPKQPKAL